MRRLFSLMAMAALAGCAGRMPYRGTAREWMPAVFNSSVTHVRASAGEEARMFTAQGAWSSLKWCQASLASDGRAQVRFDRVSARLDQDHNIWIESMGENGILYTSFPVANRNDFRKAGQKASTAAIPSSIGFANPRDVLVSVSRPTLLITTNSDSSAERIAKGFQELIAECSAKKAD